jgi:hypothetical protein
MSWLIERIKVWLRPLEVLIGPFVAIALFVGLVLWSQWGSPIVQLLVPLLLAGGLGGLVQVLIADKNKLKRPVFDPESSSYDLGVASDILIGSASALASLVVGMAILNKQFFVGPDEATAAAKTSASSAKTEPAAGAQPPAPAPGAAAVTPPPADPKASSRDKEKDDPFPAIPTSLRLISFGILTGFAGRRLLPDLSDKIANQIAGEVKKNVAKEMKTREELVRGQGEIVQLATAALSDMATGAPAARVSQLEADVHPIQGLASLVQKLMAITQITHPDYAARVQAKMAVAAEMLAYVLQSRLDSQTVGTQIRDGATDNDGWVLALAVMIANRPGAGDAERLLDAAPKATHAFVQYRVLIAIQALRSSGALQRSLKTRARRLAQGYLSSGDTPVVRKAQAIVALLDDKT